MPQEASKVAQRELKRIKKLQPSSSEWSVLRNYLELMADLPWSKKSDEVLDIQRAKQQLENDHYGQVFTFSHALLNFIDDFDIPSLCLLAWTMSRRELLSICL